MTHEVFELTSGCHGTAKGLGTDDQPDGWHHTSHATGMDELVEHRHSCFYLVVAITSLHDTPIGRDEPFVGIGIYLMYQAWLEQYGYHGSQQDSHEQDHHGGPSTGNHHTSENRYQQ